MRNTKRFLTLILALVLCLSMTACASEEDKAFEAADALLAAGDYEGAIAAFSSIGRYQEINEKIAEAEKLRNEANMGFLFGKWINIGIEDASLTLNQDGTSILSVGTEVYNTNYTYENNTVTVSQPFVFELKVEQQDGITHLVWEGNHMDFVPEADYPACAPIDIEITMDNWQEYFEMKEVNSIGVNAFGEVSSVQPTVGIFLKDEYYSRLPDNYWDSGISFELTYDQAMYQLLDCSPDDYDYDFIGQYERVLTEPRRRDDLETGCTWIGTVDDRRTYTHMPEQSPYFNTFSAEIGYISWTTTDDNMVRICGWTNIQVSRVTGTLRLFPAK